MQQITAALGENHPGSLLFGAPHSLTYSSPGRGGWQRDFSVCVLSPETHPDCLTPLSCKISPSSSETHAIQLYLLLHPHNPPQIDHLSGSSGLSLGWTESWLDSHMSRGSAGKRVGWSRMTSAGTNGVTQLCLTRLSLQQVCRACSQDKGARERVGARERMGRTNAFLSLCFRPSQPVTSRWPKKVTEVGGVTKPHYRVWIERGVKNWKYY